MTDKTADYILVCCLFSIGVVLGKYWSWYLIAIASFGVFFLTFMIMRVSDDR
jgi:phosphatidylglycerophosphate synthase